jgi:aryl-alcohol dehydrogenase-like predicted oxidoreductase
VTSALIGASSVAQLEENIGAQADVVFPPDDMVEIEQILATNRSALPSVQAV